MLHIAITSASSLKRNTGASGPKVSSCATSASGFTFESTVGSKKLPPSAWRLPPVTILAPPFDRVRNVLLDLVDRFHVDQRALHHAGFGAVADLHRCDLLRKLFDELVVDLVLGVEPVGADAGLAHVAILRDDGALDRGIDIGVVEHHERRVAAEFEAELLHADGGLAVEDFADLGRAGEADEAHGRMFAQHLADRRRIAGQDVEHALRHAGLFGERDQRQRGQRRFIGGLEHHRAARGERRRDFSGDHRARKIPRRDRAADADRLLDREQPRIRPLGRDGFAIDAAGFLGEKFDIGAADIDFAERFRQRLALLGGEDQGQVLAVGDDQVEPLCAKCWSAVWR